MNDVAASANFLGKTIGNRAILNNVSATVRPGDVVGVIGKNGAGKTTLLETLLGLSLRSSGSSTVLGEDSLHLSAEAKQRIGFVPQQEELIAALSGRRQLALTGSFYRKWDKELVARLATEWEVPLDWRTHTLSGGERQKLSTLMALGNHPDLLVLDEPVASLDPVARRKFLQQVLEIASDNSRAVIFSTHIVSDLERVANRIWMLKDGQLIWDRADDPAAAADHRYPASYSPGTVWNFSVAGAAAEATCAQALALPGLASHPSAGSAATDHLISFELKEGFMSRRTEFSRSLLVVLLVGFGTPALAAPFTVLNEDEVYDVNADGSYVVDGRVSRRVDETQAVSQAGQFALPYSESLQKLEIVEAYTTTKDGTRIDVPADKIVSQQLPASAGAPTFSDYKLKTIIFPQVDVGAVLTLHYTITQLKPQLPGVFSVHSLFNRFVDYKGATMTVRAPEKLPLYFSTTGVTGGEVKAAKPGTHEWHWTYAGATALLAEPGSVSVEDISPGISVSTLKDYPAMAAAYMIGAAPAAKATPTVQKLADEITQGIAAKGVEGKRAQAEAVYRWVSGNIRYVALFMGAGGYVPHTADEIISVKYGDCKDKTTLLTALLSAKGIRSAPVLINATNRYILPDTPVLSAFNHVITWLPDFNLFVDSTSGFAPFGVLTDGLMGKRALMAGAADQKPALATLPVSGATTDTIVLRTVATLAADGSVTGTNRIQATGIYGPVFRATLGSIPPAQLASVGPRLLTSAGQSGEATLTFSDMRDLTKPVEMEVQFKVPARVNLPGPGALTGVFGIRPPADLGALIGFIMQQERKLDFPCVSGSFDEKVELTLPQDFKISNLPHPAKVDSALASYASSYTQQDQKLIVTRRLELRYPHVVCNNADSIELRKFATSVGQDLRAQVLYQ